MHAWMLVDALEIGDRIRVDAELSACRLVAAEAGEAELDRLNRRWEGTVALLSGDLRHAEAVIAAVAGDAIGGSPQGELETEIEQLHRVRGDEPIDLGSDRVDAVPRRSALERSVFAERLARQGRAHEAEFEIDRLAIDDFGSVPRDQDWLATLACTAQACCALARIDEASRVRDLLLPYRDQAIVVGGLPYGFAGAVAHHTGALATAIGRPDAALVDLAAAVELYESLGADPWLARAQIAQARALVTRREPGDLGIAQSLLSTVESSAADRGWRGLERTARQLREVPRPDASRMAAFSTVDDGWRVEFAAETVHMRDSKGMRVLHHLLARPGEGVAATDLVRDVLGEASPDRERARVNVTRQLRTAVTHIGRHLPGLGAHLECALVTGQTCCYRPDDDRHDWLV